MRVSTLYVYSRVSIMIENTLVLYKLFCILKEGYTLYVYGTTTSASIEWRLRSLGVGEFDMLHVCQGDSCKDLSSQPPQQHQQTVHGFYVPNKDCLVTRYETAIIYWGM